LEKRGFEITRVRVDERGRVAPGEVAAAIRDDTILVSVQFANHEVGTVQDLAAVGGHCAERGVLLHTDATHAAGWIPLDVHDLGVHLLSVTGHRMYGPKGIGALYVRRRGPRVKLAPQIHGGGHERGLRAGTANVPGAVGLGRAAALAVEEGPEASRRVALLRDRLEAIVRQGAAPLRVLGDLERRLAYVTAVAIEGVEGESLLLGVASKVAFATGSACTSATLEPSYVLTAMGLGKSVVDSSVHWGLGRDTSEADVERAGAAIVDAVVRIRQTG
jgi:cysteine desulfurase